MEIGSKTTVKCSKCQAEAKAKPLKSGEEGLPMFWKRSRDTGLPVCKSCWGEMYGSSPRAITLPIRTVLPIGEDKAEWRDFAYLAACYGAKTAGMMTWMYRWLLANDPVVAAPNQKIGKMLGRNDDGDEKSLLTRIYQVGRPLFPDIDSKMFSALSKQVYSRYSKSRLATLRAERWDRGFSNPQPIPLAPEVHWKNIRKTEDGRYLVDIRIGCKEATEKNDKLMLAGKWITVVLAGGRDYWRPLAAVQKMVEGKAIPVEFAIVRLPGSGEGRPGVESSGDGKKSFDRLMLKMVAWLPREERDSSLKGRYYVRTANRTFLVARVEGAERNDPEFVVHAANLRDAAISHAIFLRKKSQDAKTEYRYGRRRRGRMGLRRGNRTERRIKTFCQQTASLLVKRAARLHVSDIVYDDSDLSYFGSFTYYQLKEALKQRLEPGMRLVLVDEFRAEAKAIKDAWMREKAERDYIEMSIILKKMLDESNGMQDETQEEKTNNPAKAGESGSGV